MTPGCDSRLLRFFFAFVGMGRKGSIVYQVMQRLEQLYAVGVSKHEAKMSWREYCRANGLPWNPAYSPRIHSLNTFKQYKKVSLRFANWARKEKGCRDLEEARQYVEEYLTRSKMSPWSVRKEMAALAKLYGCSSRDFQVEVPRRSRSEITRSRVARKHDREISLERYRDLVDFCRGTGLRRKELMALEKRDIFRDGERVFVFVRQGKGGRSRVVRVLEPYQEHVWSMRERVGLLEGKVFEYVPNRLDVHALRREYAQRLYEELASCVEASGGVYRTRDGRVYDRAVMRMVSENLGHSRLDVVAKHYLG